MDEYIKATNDVDFLLEAMPYLDKEIKFFENNRMTEYKWTNGKSYKVFFYSADCRGPRPEAYVEDMEVAGKFILNDVSVLSNNMEQLMFQKSFSTIMRRPRKSFSFT